MEHGHDGTDLILRAISFAARSHRGQTRKDLETPYVAHPLRVAFILRHLFGTEDPEVIAAAVLHDTIEDTTVDRDDLIVEFGERVAGLVAALSKDKRLPEEEREARYLEQLAGAPAAAKLIKLADTYDNLSDVASLGAPAARKSAGKAMAILDLFERDAPGGLDPALDLVRERLARGEFGRPAGE